MKRVVKNAERLFSVTMRMRRLFRHSFKKNCVLIVEVVLFLTENWTKLERRSLDSPRCPISKRHLVGFGSALRKRCARLERAESAQKLLGTNVDPSLDRVAKAFIFGLC